MLWCVCICVLLLVLGYFQVCVRSSLNGKGAVSSFPGVVTRSTDMSPQTLLGQGSKEDGIFMYLFFPVNLCSQTAN